MHYYFAWSGVLVRTPAFPQLIQKFPAFYCTRCFITMFTTDCHVSLSRARLIQSMRSHSVPLRFIVVLSSKQFLSFWHLLLPSAMHATCFTHHIFHGLITRRICGEGYKPFCSSLCHFLHSCITSPPSGPHFFLPPFRSKFLLQHPVLLLLQLVFFSERRSYSILLDYEKARHDFGAWVSAVVKALCYQSNGLGIESRWRQ